MTEKLYYQNSYIKTFSARLIKAQHDPEGNWYVVLNQTAFYPTGGGQPYDTGKLNDIPVIDVEEKDGEIRHYLEMPLIETEIVEGEIDWDRRFDHMQQHAGQHILSATFEELFNYKTVSFHLGKEVCTIDLDIGDLNEDYLRQAEQLANQIILENRPIETKWINEQEVNQYKLRKELSVKDNIRLVIIPDFDYNGCGGTHPDSTAQVVAIKLLNCERQRKRVRVQFVCGNRVLKQLGEKQKTTRQLTHLLNAPEQELENVVKQLVDRGKIMEKNLEEVKETLLEYEAKDLLKNNEVIGGKYIIKHVLKKRSMKELQFLARNMVNQEQKAIVILISDNKDTLQIVCARGEKVDNSMKTLIREILPFINGQGGGNDSLAQGGGEASLTGLQWMEQIKEVME